MKQIEATILGQSYMLACPEGGEQAIRDAVARVDREMSAIRDAGRTKARERMAVLAALNLAHERIETQRTLSALMASSSVAGEGAAAASTGQQAGGGDSAADDRQAAIVADLIRRIDASLGSDGHLL